MMKTAHQCDTVEGLFIIRDTFHGALQKFRSRSNSWAGRVLECCGLYCVVQLQKGSVDACQSCPVWGSL